jgi:hypothetical protein
VGADDVVQGDAQPRHHPGHGAPFVGALPEDAQHQGREEGRGGDGEGQPDHEQDAVRAQEATQAATTATTSSWDLVITRRRWVEAWD